MKFIRNKVTLATVLILVLSLCFLSVASLFSLVQATPWTKYTGEVTLKDGVDNELFVVDAWVIKDGSTYKMWYTHSKTDMAIEEMAGNLTTLISSDIISDLLNLDLDQLLDDLSLIDADTLWNFLNDTSTVIGYATSDDGKVWTRVDPEVLSSDAGLKNVGMPCVIKNGDTDYEMWFTHSETELTQSEVENILSGLGSSDNDARKSAILAILDANSTSIGHATSSDGEDWGTPQFGIFNGEGSGLWDSVADPCVVNDSGTYKMWYTYAETDIIITEIDNILTNIGDFGVSDILNILDKTHTSIKYTTSADGTTWTDPTTEVLAGNGGMWDSVAAPCVINNGSGYEMWYTNLTTNLISSSFQALFSAMQALETDILSLWSSFTSGDLNTFLVDLQAFLGEPDADPPIAGTIDPVLSYLANTSARIGYATSDDGTIWVEQNPNALTGSGGPWGSVGAPCVVLDSGTYEMWFTQGVEYLTAQNIVSLMDGSILPIGYATELDPMAVTNAYPTLDDNVAIVAVEISGKNLITSLPAPLPGGVSAYTMTVTGDPLGIDIVEVRPVAPFDSLVYDLNDYITTGTFTISGTASVPMEPPDYVVVKLVIRLIGDASTKYYLGISFNSITAAGPPEIAVPEEAPNTLTFLRGDTTNNGIVDIFDALFIAQYTVAIRDINEINAINASSIAYSSTNLEYVDIFDALFIAQQTVGIRDENFVLVP
ncbi:MAG: hypothetical protein ABH934_03670 [Chloroflexota bacterium]